VHVRLAAARRAVQALRGVRSEDVTRDVRHRVAAILRTLRPLRSAIEPPRRTTISAWLDLHGIPGSVIAEVVSNRTTGLRRPSTAKAIQRLTVEEEQRLIVRFRERLLAGGMDPAQANREAERHTIRAARGGESPAAAQVRKAINRDEAAGARLTDALLVPESHDRAAFLVTQMIQADAVGDPQRVSELLRDLRQTLLDLD
jgi:hypothetical protein